MGVGVEALGGAQCPHEMPTQKRVEESPFPCANHPLRNPLPQQRHLDRVQKTAVNDIVGRQQWEGTLADEILAKQRIVRSSHGRV
jgi:hypothetical protein